VGVLMRIEQPPPGSERHREEHDGPAVNAASSRCACFQVSCA
jgi:hypothetical protein